MKTEERMVKRGRKKKKRRMTWQSQTGTLPPIHVIEQIGTS